MCVRGLCERLCESCVRGVRELLAVTEREGKVRVKLECGRQESLLIRCGIPTRKKAKSVTQIRDKDPDRCLEFEWRVVVGANVGSAKS